MEQVLYLIQQNSLHKRQRLKFHFTGKDQSHYFVGASQCLLCREFNQAHSPIWITLLKAAYRYTRSKRTLVWLILKEHQKQLFICTSYHVNCMVMCRNSVDDIATGYGLDDRGVGISVPLGSRIFSSTQLPHQFWGPATLLSNWYWG
jgi:hypothetical protein